MNEPAPRYSVVRVPVERTLALRKTVLRPDLGPDQPYRLPDDDLPTTVAYGALTDGDELIGVVRITPEPPPFALTNTQGWRLRGMAAAPEVRNRGVGSALLGATIAHVGRAGGGILWCNARLAAVGLYQRGGLQRWGEVWEEPDIGPHVVMWRDVAGGSGEGSP
jgi:GNAT superfamily N-acetyltransferase